MLVSDANYSWVTAEINSNGLLASVDSAGAGTSEIIAAKTGYAIKIRRVHGNSTQDFVLQDNDSSPNELLDIVASNAIDIPGLDINVGENLAVDLVSAANDSGAKIYIEYTYIRQTIVNSTELS